MAEIERTDIVREPQYPGIMFGDGHVGKAISILPDVDSSGIEIWKIVLYPSPQLVKAYNITLDQVDRNGLISVEYPREMVQQLSPDPSFPFYFCFLNFRGQETEATKFWRGYIDKKEIMELKRIIQQKKAENAYLTEQLEKAKANVRQFIKEEIAGPAQELNAQLLAQQLGQQSNLPLRNQ